MTAVAGTDGWWVLWIDGGARGNPGPAGAGAVLHDPAGRRIAAQSFPLGRTTNNDAEYAGLIHGLGMARNAGARRLEIRSDSELLVRQMTGEYRIRAPHLQEAAARAREAAQAFTEVLFTAIPREANREADRLANRAMDEGGGGRRAGNPDGMVRS
ncbi:MAG: ribonuclease HI family protein [Candidatus Coatesbacteria bacterium]